MEWNKLLAYAIVVISLAVVDLTGIAVVTAYKQTGLVDNTTADRFVTGLAYFGLFIGIMVISVVGKMIIGLFTSGKTGL